MVFFAVWSFLPRMPIQKEHFGAEAPTPISTVSGGAARPRYHAPETQSTKMPKAKVNATTHAAVFQLPFIGNTSLRINKKKRCVGSWCIYYDGKTKLYDSLCTQYKIGSCNVSIVRVMND